MKAVIAILVAVAVFVGGVFSSQFILDLFNMGPEAETVYVEVAGEPETPSFDINVGETFHAEMNAVINSIGTSAHMNGRQFYVSNFLGDFDNLDGWSLSVEWRSADSFFGNPPENWEEATEDERNEYFIDYLINWGGLLTDQDIEEITVSMFWPADGINADLYTERTGKMVQYQSSNAFVTSIAIEYYSYFMQFDEAGAFFIVFNNFATEEERFNENQRVFEEFLSSITLWRFHQH
ncbi:MAG: hypothetical protein FWD82_11130 [Defluviitaleaceae bacterium]|nr:hypothetical protein [Defluviitaleaceae bacterium]